MCPISCCYVHIQMWKRPWGAPGKPRWREKSISLRVSLNHTSTVISRDWIDPTYCIKHVVGIGRSERSERVPCVTGHQNWLRNRILRSRNTRSGYKKVWNSFISFSIINLRCHHCPPNSGSAFEFTVSISPLWSSELKNIKSCHRLTWKTNWSTR